MLSVWSGLKALKWASRYAKEVGGVKRQNWFGKR